MHKPIPQEWLDVLSRVQTVSPSAIIAGGALRDLYNDKPIKDVDIFIAYNPIIDFEIGELFCDTTKVFQQHDEYNGVELLAVYESTIDGVLYNFIVCTEEHCDINNFDINICQISCDGKKLSFTAEYSYGIRDKVIRIVNVNCLDENRKRVERIHNKYPEFKVQVDHDESLWS